MSEKMGQLKLAFPDGKYYKTDVLDTENLLRLIQSIPSPKISSPYNIQFLLLIFINYA